MDKVISKLRKKIKVDNVEDIGKITRNGVPLKLKLIDGNGNFIGTLVRAIGNRRKLVYSFQTSKGAKIKMDSFELLDGAIPNKYNMPVLKGEQIMYGDLGIPKKLTNEVSGLGKLILDDAKQYFLSNAKLGKVDGNFGYWLKLDIYSDYGGQSVNLKKFWEEMAKNGENVKKAAFETFTGKWAEKNGFANIYIKNFETDIKQIKY